MALQAFTLVPVNPKSLMEITPKNWHRYPVPPPTGTLTPVWVRQQQVLGGVVGDDVNASTATYVTDKIAANGPNTATDYAPRNAQQKATALGMTFGNIVTRRRGAIGAKDPYPTASSPAPAAPTITSLTPNTIAAGGPDILVRITGTNFTQWSDVYVGGSSAPYKYVRYISPTAIDVMMDVTRSVAGTATIAVVDHSVASTPAATFTFT